MSDLTADLNRLVIDNGAPEKVRQHADALLKRLRAPVKVSVCGPDTAMVAHLLQTLPPVLSNAALSDQLTDADIAVWCTQQFNADEVAFWESAALNLQDHSLLVGPPGEHIQLMGVSYFRQLCAQDAVAGILKRQIKQGQEADTDQALALLIRHPPADQPATPAPVPSTPAIPATQASSQENDNQILSYLQTRADALAKMDVQDTDQSIESVLAHCSQTVHHLSDLIAAVPDQGLQDAVFDAVDAITLMMLEGDIAAAADAVTTLINLKTKFEGAVRQIETNTV